MRVLVQRVTEASVRVDDAIVGAIGPGLLLLVGVTTTDGTAEVDYLTGKIANLRIFPDDSGTMNRSARDQLAAGAPVGMLVVSQFTLYADTRKGRRPSYVNAAPPPVARPLIDAVVTALQALGFVVATGQFGAKMAVALVNDGPVTIWLDTADR